MQVQVDALGVELTKEAEQILQRPAKAVHRPGRNHVDLAPGDGLQQPVEPRPLVAALGAADACILELGHDMPAVALGGYFGVWSARRVPQLAVRIFVIAVGLFLTVYYFF